ncbi:uncharacterized protein I303_106220 [Kwoniella dejecticola CBS 10117]|uniref:Uncharacterized protein n=1 Tax=Kwoniella dejecticola CBS 10117 TaxID=1296121 RepID=A0A1A6A1L3_9TREE|nr:uncharacterized protein I303_06239 [Kwoniella dejecticola CBS 10117]OBR83952.1 hypothetical protein I303_06239 [Kwoniella dejecticola CBS 10117]
MAPTGLVISKLGIQATASDDVVRGLMCLKISLPKDSDGRPGARWTLFGSSPPRITTTPTIYPLPLPLPASRNPQLRTASKLLALPQPSTYPPSPPSGLGGKPYIDISSTTGKVYLVVDPVSSRRNSQSSRVGGPSSQSTSRKEWLICMEFEVPLESGMEEGISKVLLPVPKCLDNTIRFQILSPNIPSSSSSSVSCLNQEVNILTDPKMLPLPSNAFGSDPSPRNGKGTSRGHGKSRKGQSKMKSTVGEDGWEDGEVLGADDVPSGSSDDGTEMSDEGSVDSEEGSWLEGRFPSTEILRLEWSFHASPSSDIPSLQITPLYAKQSSSISIAYISQVPVTDNPVSIDIDVPDGWGWSDFTIQGESLLNWRCSDGDWGSSIPNPDDTLQEGEYEDSFATIRAKPASSRRLTPASSTESGQSDFLPTIRSTSNASSSASLMRQTFPSLNERMEDFSFEMSSVEHKPPTPKSLRKSPMPNLLTSTSSKGVSTWEQPKFGKTFSLYFDEGHDRTITLQGTLVVSDKGLLVSPNLPIKMPFIQIDGQSTQCQIECPCATYGAATTESSVPELVDAALVGSFRWTTADGVKFSPDGTPLKSDVRIRLRRSPWGAIRASMIVAVPSKSQEVGFSISHEQKINLLKTTIGGVDAPRAIYSGGGIQQILVGSNDQKPGGVLEVEWECLPGIKGEIALPVFEDAEGVLKVDLVGDEWTSNVQSVKSNMRSISPLQYTHSLSSSVKPTLSLSLPGAAQSRRKTLLSVSTLLNLILLWLFLSMGQQLHRLKSEIDFVRDEYKDLRMYGVQSPLNQQSEAQPLTPTTTITTTATATTILTEVVTITSTTGTLQPGRRPSDAKSVQGDLVEVHRTKYDLGRVVRRNMNWENWLAHPT